jgi:hypothetical protein
VTLLRTVCTTAVLALTASAFPGPEAALPAAVPVPMPPSTLVDRVSAGEGMGVEGVGAGEYKELFCYSSVVRPNYVPGYTPHVSSLYENPREYPKALCVLATPYYLHGRRPGWFFGSPNGYQSSVPPGSQALAYNRGELGITQQLAFGYPEGMRVVERVLVPYSTYCRPGGYFISAGSATRVETATGEAAVRPTPSPLRAPDK